VGELIFPAFIGNIFNEKCNILQFVGDINKKYSPFEVSFCNEKYPVSDIGIKQLTKDLQNASIINGYNLVRNGHRTIYSTGCKQISFCCHRVRKYHGNLQKRQAAEYREKSYHSAHAAFWNTLTYVEHFFI
jgi:hypothetical protein